MQAFHALKHISVSIALICAAYMAIAGRPEWGWFIGAAILIGLSDAS